MLHLYGGKPPLKDLIEAQRSSLHRSSTSKLPSEGGPTIHTVAYADDTVRVIVEIFFDGDAQVSFPMSEIHMSGKPLTHSLHSRPSL